MQNFSKVLLSLSAAAVMALSTGCSSSDDDSAAAAVKVDDNKTDTNTTKETNATKPPVVVAPVDDITRVVYRSNQYVATEHDLYVNVDGAWKTLYATNHPGDSIIDFQLSPDKNTVAFRVNTNTGRELYIQSIVDGQDTDARLVYDKTRDGVDTSENDVINFAWAPDGTKIAYLADQNKTLVNARDLFVYHLESKRNTIVNTPKPYANSLVSQFFWAPNSEYIAFIADRNSTTGKNELFVMNPAGNYLTVASENDVSNTTAQVSQAYWAPDSHAIAYIANEVTGSGTELHIAQQDLDGTVTILPSIGIAAAGRSVFSAQWSPTSDRIAYTSNNDAGSLTDYQLYTVNSLLNTERKYIKTPSGQYPQTSNLKFGWSPNGATLAFTAVTTSAKDLYYVGAKAELATKANLDITGSLEVSNFTFSSDSKMLAYNANTTNPTLKDLYVTTLATNARVRVAGTEMQGGVVENDFQFSPNDAKLVYRANQANSDGKINLYSTPVSRDTNGTQINDGVFVYSDVETFRITADSDTVVFSEDKTDDDMIELYSVSIGGGTNEKLSDMFLTSDGDIDGDFVTR